MNFAAWLGLGLGAVIGVICGLWQAVDMRRSARTGPGVSAGISTVLRLVFLMVAMLAAARYGGANKYWLAGSAALAYSAVFGWNLKQVLPKKK